MATGGVVTPETLNESLADRVKRLDSQTSDLANGLRATQSVVPSETLYGKAARRFVTTWMIKGGLIRGHGWTFHLAFDVLEPVLGNLKAELEPDPTASIPNPFADAPPPRQDRTGASAPKLSAVVSAHNEQDKLAACLGRLGFADEIVVLLDKCTDDTRAIAEAYSDRVIDGHFSIEGDRRNAAIAACRGDWVLEVDADEHASESMGSEVRHLIETSQYDWHEIPVDNVIGGTLVRKGWGASYGKAAYPGLFRRGTKKWGKQRVHPSLTWTAPRGRGPMLKTPITHYVDRDVSDMIRRLNSYSTARATDIVERGEVNYLFSNLRRFVSRFHKCYVRRGGKEEGGYGFLIAVFAGLYPLLSYAKACEYRRSVRKAS